MATFKSEAAFNAACNKLFNAVAEAEANADAVIHVGKTNGKTGASVNEGTTPVVTCCEHACKTCARSCYAILHVDNIYTAARRNHAENTVMRRRNAAAYYEAFFREAFVRGTMLRINETGDFENIEQFNAFKAVAKKYPTVKVIGYTRRIDLVPAVADLTKRFRNIALRYSCFTDEPSAYDVGARSSVRTCRVDAEKTSCLAQIYADKGSSWTCAACAAGCKGCFSKAACVTFRLH